MLERLALRLVVTCADPPLECGAPDATPSRVLTTFYDLFLGVRQSPQRKMLQFAKIFIGDVVTVGSDQAILAAVVAHFEATSTPAVILTNVNLGGRQLDCVAVTATRAVVLEAKGYHRRLRGGPNGAWEVELAGGAWKAIQSPYLQVLGGRHALRDAMAMFDGGSVPYPDAAVVFAPTIPPNSQLSSDFKVAIRGLDELPSELSQGGAQGWPLDKWEAFARHHRLNEVPDVATACSPVLAEAHALLARYASGFLRTYRPLTTGIVDALWENGEASVTSAQLMSHLTRGGDAYLLGPSGCGKSMTAYGAAAGFGVYSACMDHPYSNAYAAVFNALPPEDRATLLTMAARGAGDDSFFLSPLIVETASLSDKLATEALQRFLAPPRKDSFNPGDAIQAFTLAHLAYGQNGLALPHRRDDENDPAGAALSACGTIL